MGEEKKIVSRKKGKETGLKSKEVFGKKQIKKA